MAFEEVVFRVVQNVREPGRASDSTRDSTGPPPRGSVAIANTIGMRDVAHLIAGTADPAVTMTSALTANVAEGSCVTSLTQWAAR